MDSCDVVVIGAGIGGSAVATALAGDGLEVHVLEQTVEYEDRVRGESMMPWGVAEARELGVEQTLLDAGGHVAAQWTNYHLPDEQGEIPIGIMVPGVGGSLNLRHPDACAALEQAAAAAGAHVHRGTRDLELVLGAEPIARWNDTDGAHEMRCRIVVGSDGRASRVRKALGLELQRAPILNHIAGLLISGLEIDNSSDFIAGEGDLFMAGFHQEDGRARVYLCPGVSQANRFTGVGKVEQFLSDCAFECLPFGKDLARGTPAGPLATYPGDDTWIDRPFGHGAVLIADAAGYSNPIIGQGLSIAMRDARTVRDVLRGGDWSPAAFDDYAAERAERMRRLRFIADSVAIPEAEDADNRDARRAKWRELNATDERAFLAMVGALAGPETVPAEAFADELHAMVRAA